MSYGVPRTQDQNFDAYDIIMVMMIITKIIIMKGIIIIFIILRIIITMKNIISVAMITN